MRTFKEAFDLLTRAYINNEVEPWYCEACFVGNLLGSDIWSEAQYKGWDPSRALKLIHSHGYKVTETRRLEDKFLQVINQVLTGEEGTRQEWLDIGMRSNDYSLIRMPKREHPKYEDALFQAFEATLDLLKEIHRSKGEDVDNTLVFKKRELVAA